MSGGILDKLYILAFGFLAVLCTAGNVRAQDGQAAQTDKGKVLDVNPLETYQMKIKDLKMDCQGSPDKRKCDQKVKDLRQEMVDLAKYCRENRTDEKCGAIMTDKRDELTKLEAFCLNNPHEPKCVRRSELKKFKEKRKRQYCQKHADDRRCKTRPPKDKRNYFDYLTQHCEEHPESFKCRSFNERNLAKQPPAEKDTNSF